VLNATGPQPEAQVTEIAWADHLAQLNFFVKSPVLLGRAVLPGMQARRFGRVVHIDSEVAHRPPPGRSAYATAKSAQVGLTYSWARELAPFGITVNTVAPGFVPVERHAGVPREIRDAYLASVPAGRMGTPADIAHPVSFLTSEASDDGEVKSGVSRKAACVSGPAAGSGRSWLCVRCVLAGVAVALARPGST